jgi:23S rRNA pseudouridine2604 synthase
MASAGGGARAGLVRANKLLQERGLASRRRADELLHAGHVLVDGEACAVGAMVRRDAHVELSREASRRQQSLLTFVLNKPVSFVSQCSNAELRHTKRMAADLLSWDNQWTRCPYNGKVEPRRLEPRLAVAGRLDSDSEGLLVLTQDGRVARALVGDPVEPSERLEKEYVVSVVAEDFSLGLAGVDLRASVPRPRSAPWRGAAGRADQQQQWPPQPPQEFPEQLEREWRHAVAERLRSGMMLDGRALRDVGVSWQPGWRDEDGARVRQLNLVLREGRFRQVRRMCEQVGLRVTRLRRVRIGGLNLCGMHVGMWRLLTPHGLREMLGEADVSLLGLKST